MSDQVDAAKPQSLLRNEIASGNGAAFILVFAWGMNFPLVEQLLLHWDILSTTASRQAIGASLLLTLLWVRKGRFPLYRSLPWRRMFILGLAGPVCSSLLTTLAIFTAGSVSVAIVYAMGPLVAAVVARAFFRIPLVKGLAVGIALAVIGGIIVKSPQLSEARLTGGEGFMLLALVCWTWHSVAAQKWLNGFTQTEIAAYTIFPGSFLLVVLTLLVWLSGLLDVHAPLNGSTIPLALAIGTVPIAIGNLMWHVGVSKLGVTPMALRANLVPVAAILLAMWFGVLPQPTQIFGGLFVLAGVLYAQFAARKHG